MPRFQRDFGVAENFPLLQTFRSSIALLCFILPDHNPCFQVFGGEGFSNRTLKSFCLVGEGPDKALSQTVTARSPVAGITFLL